MTTPITKEHLRAHIKKQMKQREMHLASPATEQGFREYLEMEIAVNEIALAAMDAEPVADVVAWHKEGEERTCDIRWRRFDVAPGPLFAVAQPVAVDNTFIPKNLDRALGVVGVALPESKEEFNFQIERWIQRLIDRVIRYADEFKEQPAPVVPEGHGSVIAEQLAHVLSGMEVTDHQRAIISCAVDRLNKNAAMIKQKPASLTVPEVLDYQGAKELFNYLMNEEETNATVNGWNACRAAMLQAGNYPAIPDAWIACSERMPKDAQWCAVNTEYGYYVQCWSDGQGWLGDEISIPNCDVTHWIPLPEAPQQEGK